MADERGRITLSEQEIRPRVERKRVAISRVLVLILYEDNEQRKGGFECLRKGSYRLPGSELRKWVFIFLVYRQC